MGLRSIDVVATLILNLIHCAYAAEHILSCNVTALAPCPGLNQVCNQATQQCECLPGLAPAGPDCGPPEPEPPAAGAHAATVAVITIFTLALVVCGLVLVVRKYNLVEYARQKINMRRNNDIMYEDVMIGQDDPPLSP